MIESVLNQIPRGMGYWMYQVEIAWYHVNLALPMDVFGRPCSSLSRRHAFLRSEWPVNEVEDMSLTVTHVELDDSPRNQSKSRLSSSSRESVQAESRPE